MRSLCTPARVFTLVGLVTLAMLLPVGPAQAHPAGDFYGTARWVDGAVHNYGYQSNFPTGAFRSRATAGKNEWNNNGNTRTPRFNAFQPDSHFLTWSQPCNNAHGAVFWASLSGTTIGRTYRCVVSNQIRRFSVVVDSHPPSGRSWYTGTGTPSSSQVDLHALVAHEFGHVTGGWTPNENHFSGTTLCPQNADRHTMCASIIAGTTWQRHLNLHDAHTYRSAY